MPPKSHNNLQVTQKAATANPQDNSSPPAPTAVQTELRWINGPIPSADELARYERIIPGSAERFLQLHERQITIVEEQAHHRISIERGVIFGDMKRSNIGLGLGFAICLGGVLMSYSLGMHGHDWLAGSTFVTEIGGMAGIFVYGTRSRRDERKDRLNAVVKEQRDASSE